MKNRISILDPDLVFEHKDHIQSIDYWKRVLNIQIGWHYDIDLVWILDTIDKLQLKPGATIMDAGAGNGLIQFILAAKGYKVLSVDFSERPIPKEAGRIFNIERFESKKIQNHRYQSFIKHNRFEWSETLKKVDFSRPLRTFNRATQLLAHSLDPLLWKETLQSNKNYGKIIYAQADFTDMSDFASKSVDCVISVSAIEHNEPENLPKALNEFERVLKPGGSLVITTSAAKEKEKYLDFCQGWCFTASKLKELFKMQVPDNFDQYDTYLNKLMNNTFIRKRIPKLYFESGENGLPWGKYPPAYQPVGILKQI